MVMLHAVQWRTPSASCGPSCHRSSCETNERCDCRAAALLAAADAVRCAMAHTLAQLQLYLATGVIAPALEALQGELQGAKTLEEVRAQETLK